MIARWSLAEALDHLGDDLVARAVDRLDALDPILHAFVAEAREQRDARIAAPRRGALAGLPIAIKDNFHVAGMESRAGTLERYHGDEGTLVNRLRRRGAVVVGKTQMTELAGTEPAETKNPHDLARTPGGSSSGSAAAVAAGIVPLAIGSQTTWSVIGPAAYCGIVGFKPTFGRIPFDGAIAMAPSMDTVGFFAQDAEGLARIMPLLTLGIGVSPAARPKKLVAPGGALLAELSDEARDAFEDWLAHQPIPVERREPMGDAALARSLQGLSTLLCAEMSRVHRGWFDRHGKRLRRRTVEALRFGESVPDAMIPSLQGASTTLRRTLEAPLEEGVLWVTPSSAGPAQIGYDETGYGFTTGLFSWAGMPAISLPAGTIEGMPWGVQLVGRAGRDEELLAAARAISALSTPASASAGTP